MDCSYHGENNVTCSDRNSNHFTLKYFQKGIEKINPGSKISKQAEKEPQKAKRNSKKRAI